jgi:hypothetical protein
MPGYSEVLSFNSLGATPVLAVGHKAVLMAARSVNLTAADAYVQIFDATSAGAVTVGTTIPTWVIQADANDPSVGDGLPTDGLVFDNGIVVASTTTSVGATTASQHVRIGIQ